MHRIACFLGICLLLCSCAPKEPMSISKMHFLCTNTEELSCGPADQETICSTAIQVLQSGKFTTAVECEKACDDALETMYRKQAMYTCAHFKAGAEDACAVFCETNYP